MRMNVLVLINPAGGYKRFFAGLAHAFRDFGHNVIFAADSRRHIFTDPIPEVDANFEIHHFDDFCQMEGERQDVGDYAYDCTWGDFCYSDYDRFITKNYNLHRKGGHWERSRRLLDIFFERIISERKIDFVVYENVSNSFEYSAYRMIEKSGGKYYGIIMSRIPGMYEIQTSILRDELDRIEVLRQEKPTLNELTWFRDYRARISEIQPDYMKNSQLSKIGVLGHVNKNNFKKLIGLFRAQIRCKHAFDYANASPVATAFNAVGRALRRRINVAFTRNVYSKEGDLLCGGLFYVYPMHYHPESSTSVLSPQYTNEFNNIINIANNLPFGAVLCVKDHRSAHGLQNSVFFKKLSAHPAVKFASPSFNIKTLIANSAGVITVNSTAGYEALLLGKPVYMLGHAFYEKFANVYQLKNFEDLRFALSGAGKWLDVTRDFIAYKRYCYEGQLDFSGVNGVREGLFDEIVANIVGRHECERT